MNELELLLKLEHQQRRWFSDPENGDVSCRSQQVMASILGKLDKIRKASRPTPLGRPFPGTVGHVVESMKKSDQAQKAYLDGLDWAIRQMQTYRHITMRQMILLFRIWSAVFEKGGRLTDAHLQRIAKDYIKQHGELYGKKG